ncbi:autotransporter assembly complex protein TamA [Arenibaculum pallidiluteum]|uniref:autotransporter assembly complex protein TamA n=1 Tax=Arenibaculum pallidiluteum TaxID=2812559 RepID=UPI002E2BA452|nr:autotransporter assembly complex family protein [Arenibaculum pallidiluteum]
MAGPLHPMRLAAVFAVLALCFAGAPARAQQTPYEPTLTGVDDGELADLIRSTASLFRLRDEPPPSPVGLQRRADSDRDSMVAALRSFGYYESAIDIRIDTAASPAKVEVAIEPGPLYRYDDLAVTGPEDEAVPELEIDRRALGLEEGEPARARNVVDAEGRLTGQLAGKGFAFAKVADRRVVIDRSDKTMDITYVVERGPLVRFGPATITGLEQVEERIVRNRLPWTEGQVYDAALVEEARQSIAALGPFGAVRVALAEEPGPEGVTPLSITIDERPPRVIGFGFEYSSIDGFGANARWGHRNLFGGSESLDANIRWSRIGLDASTDSVEDSNFSAEVAFRKPDYLLRNQTLLLGIQVLRENAEAYIRDAVVLNAGFEYRLTPDLSVRYGIQGDKYRDRANEFRTSGTLVGLPLGIAWDKSDDLLNPTRGFRTDLEVTPLKQLAEGSDFVVGRWTTSGYHDIAADGNYVLAGRVSLGSIVGSSLSGIPPHRRFFSGGGGSIRGYGYQEVGPRDSFGDPRGGLSLFESSIELRYKLTESIGVVPFVDAGNVYDTNFPKIGSDLKYAAGLGARYYTGFGPLRADVAVPLNKEPGDASWAFYISIGQAF